MKGRAGLLATAVIAAGVLHAAAGHHLATLDPITALLGHHDASVVVAAVSLVVARLFLYVVAPGLAACFVAGRVARAIAGRRSPAASAGGIT